MGVRNTSLTRPPATPFHQALDPRHSGKLLGFSGNRQRGVTVDQTENVVCFIRRFDLIEASPGHLDRRQAFVRDNARAVQQRSML